MTSPVAAALPSILNIRISDEIFTTFPDAKIAFLILSTEVLSKKNQPKAQQTYLSDLKQRSVKQVVDMGITPDNYEKTRVCQSWENVFNSFHTGEDKRSTIANLLRKASQEGLKVAEGKKADMGAISNFVDFYNAISIQTLTPMGATDISKIAQKEGKSTVELRFAKDDESFIPLGRESVEVPLTPQSVVYADQEKILTGFWNWKDSKECCVPNESVKTEGGLKPEYILLVADQAEQDRDAKEKPIQERPGDVEEAILRSMGNLHQIGGTWYAMDILNSSRREVSFDLSQIREGDVTVLKA